MHYARLNMATVLGIALSTAILVGAFIIGDSVKYSLQQITLERLGKTEQVITAGERLFTQQLADNIEENENVNTSAILRANGIAIVDGGQTRVNKIQVWGIDENFGEFADSEKYQLHQNEVVINEKLATILKLNPGDEFLLRVNKLSTFPSNTPFVSAEENTVSFRVKLKAIGETLETGNLNLQNIQSSPRNIFINIDWLNKRLELENKANVILLSGIPENIDQYKLIENNWSLEDINLKIRENEELGYTEIISDRVFIEPAIESAKLPENPSSPVFSYFVNELKLRGKTTPYSFVSSVSEGLQNNEIIINKWLADDLSAKTGDSLRVSYFEVGPLRKLIEHDTTFVVKEIVGINGKWGDVNLMPEIPGLSDAGHCRDWETGVPVDLNSIREKDEEYWNNHKGTPKAFISLEIAQNLWQNRFGKSTAIRFKNQDKQHLSDQLLGVLSAEKLGFQIQDARTDGLQAASTGVDFGELFIGLSFFVLVAAVLLTVLLFKLFLNFRKNEIGTLNALGFTRKQVQKIFFAEAIILVIIGIGIGIPFSLLYNKLILSAVNSIWVDIVMTSIVHIHIEATSLISGGIAIFILSFAVITFVISRFLKQETIALQKNIQEDKKSRKNIGRWLGWSLVIVSVAAIFTAGISAGEVNPEVFFIGGFGLLPGMILLANQYLVSLHKKAKLGKLNFSGFVMKRIAQNRRQNVMIISFLSIGIFMVISTGVNRNDLTKNADQNFSGTGGYLLFAETTIPVLEDLNQPEVADYFGFPENAEMEIAQFRVKPGDDASCLNLNRIARPQVLGFNPEQFNRRKAFTFITQTEDLNEQSPWLSLKNRTTDGFVPAIADQTVIKWGLGKNVGDTLVYQNERGEKLTLKLIGGLANSIFQGNVLIDEQFFIENYPSVSGSNILLIDFNPDVVQLGEDLKRGFRNYGVEITPTAQRLMEFYRIENTYLNIFLMLGALGLLIGTVGLGILIFRIVTEKASEYALLLAIGFRKRKIYQLIFTEKLLVIFIAIVVGLLPSVVSAIPAATSMVYSSLVWIPLIVTAIVLISTLIWTALAIYFAMRKNLVSLLREE